MSTVISGCYICKTNIEQKQMQSLDPHSLALIKYEPNDVLFLHKISRVTYRYLNCPSTPMQSQICHPYILSGIPFDLGYLYPKQQSTLKAQIEVKNHSRAPQHFDQAEISNTFIPLFQCLNHIHSKGQLHGSVHLENILIVEEEIKIRDWRAPTARTIEYYLQKKQPQDDIQALGTCLLSCLLLTTAKPDRNQLQNLLEQIVDKYSKPFVLAVIAIIQQSEECYPFIPDLLEGKVNSTCCRLNQHLDKIRLEKDKKNMISQEQESGSQVQQPSVKKITFNYIKKTMNYDNIENKLEGEAKRSSDKLLKTFQKLSLTHQLMNKKLNQEQKRANQESKRIHKTPILNLSNFGVQNNNKKSQRQRPSPSHRPRHYSKKK